jgi:hypothetical protein
MTAKQFPTDILEQAIDAQEAWGQIDEGLVYGNVSLAALVTDIAQIRTLDHTLSNLETQLTEVRNRREAVCQAAWDKVKRVRAGIKASFGDDSTQYEMIGGKRLSDRKPVRRAPALQPDVLPGA